MNRGFKLTVIAVWLLATAWLIRYEAFPELFSGSTLSYRNIINADVLLRESWHKITLKGKDIGYVFTSVTSKDRAGTTLIEITSKTHINLGLPVRTDDIVLETVISLDSAYNLLNIDSDLKAPGINLRNMVEKQPSGKYMLTSFRTDTNQSRTEERSLPANAVVFIPPTDILPGRLRSGVKAYMRVIDPLSLDVSTVTVETVDPDNNSTFGLARRFHWTRVEHRGMDFVCGRDSEDNVEFVRAPLGIMLSKCTVDEALDAAGLGPDSGPALDLDPEKVTQYVESLVGPLSTVIKLKNRKNTDD